MSEAGQFPAGTPRSLNILTYASPGSLLISGQKWTCNFDIGRSLRGICRPGAVNICPRMSISYPMTNGEPAQTHMGNRGKQGTWDRSSKWNQLRSTRRQRGEWMHGVRHDRRSAPRRSARCEKRGVKSSQEFGVAKLGTVEPARRSSLLSSAWWTGPPPIPRRGPPRATNRMTRSSRRSPSRGAACGFWIRAWGQREPALQGTGRLSNPARSGLAAQGWIGRPGNSLSIELMLHRTPDPDVGALCLVTR